MVRLASLATLTAIIHNANLTLIIVYCGAIAIIFLFVIMMVTSSTSSYPSSSSSSLLTLPA